MSTAVFVILFIALLAIINVISLYRHSAHLTGRAEFFRGDEGREGRDCDDSGDPGNDDGTSHD